MSRRRARRLAMCAAALTVGLAGLSALSATAVAAPGTFVDGHRTVHGTAVVRTDCNATVDPPSPLPSTVSVGVTISSSAWPQPPDLDQVTLSDTTARVSFPADLLQPGIDAGIYGDGQTLPVTISPVIAGSNTVEAMHEYEENTTVTVHVVDGQAQPLTADVQLPDTIWHPASPGLDLFFALQSVRVVVVIDPLSVISSVVWTLECAPSQARVFIALGGVCAPAPEGCGTTTGPTTSMPIVGIDPPIVDQTTAPPGATTLPRTGSSSGSIVFVGLSCVAAGALLLVRRRRDVAR